MRPLRYASTLLLFALGAAASSAPAASQTAPRGFATPYGTDFDGRAGVAVSRAADGGGPGALDPSFGTDGIASFAAPEAGGLAVQPDGKILTAGRFIGQAAVFRFLPDGAPDPDFGSNGIALVDLGGSLDFFGALALQPDGKIVAAGSKFLTGNGDGDGAALARFLPDGTLDADFGTGGLVLEPGTPQSDTPDAFWSVDLRPDGRIIAGGLRGVVFAGSEDNACYAAQYLPDGTRDVSFGDSGLVSADPDADIFCSGGTLLPDGRYVLSADVTNFEWAAVRLLEDGTLDPAFGTGGIATAGGPVGFLGINEPAVAPDGSVLLKGFNTAPVATLLRFTADGALDATFGTDGVATLSGIGPSRANHVAIQPDGKYLLTGDTELQGGDTHVLLARVMPNGSLDPDFGTSGDGFTTFSVPEGSGSGIGWTVGLDAEGRVLVVGNDYDASPTLSFVARFENDLPVATEPGTEPHSLILDAPAPNPARTATTLAFILDRPQTVRLVLYDALGREVAMLLSGQRAAGPHAVALDAASLSPGLYIARLTAGAERATRRLVVAR